MEVAPLGPPHHRLDVWPHEPLGALSPRRRARRPKTKWYGLTQSVAEVGLAGALLFGRKFDSGGLMGVALGTMILQAPICHLVYGNWRRALLSFGLRASLAFTGLFFSVPICINTGANACPLADVLLGPAVAIQFVALIDDLAIARLKVPHFEPRNEDSEVEGPTWSMGPILVPDGAGVGATLAW